MVRLRHTLPLLLLWPLLLGSGEGDEDTPPVRSALWQDVLQPGLAEQAAALEQGRKLYLKAHAISLSSLRRAAGGGAQGEMASKLREARKGGLRRALAAFDRAVSLLPKHSEGHFWRGRVLYELEEYARAAEAYARAEALDPPLSRRNAYMVAADLGIIYSKLGKLAEAVEAYDRAARLLDDPELDLRARRAERSRLLANAAESLMALGRLDESIQRYEAALVRAGSARERRLVQWGLAVAYDRDEQVSQALDLVRKAVARDPEMAILTDPDVFFVPEGEVHYYFALGYLVKGQRVQAEQQWKRYLAKLPDHPWAYRARAHLEQLAARSADAAGKRLAPRPGQTRGDAAERDRRRVVRAIAGRHYTLYRCYRPLLRKTPDLAGRVRLAITVNKKGRLSRTKTLHSTLESRPLKQCLLRTLGRLSHGRLSGNKPVTVEYTFEFKPGL